MNTNKQNNDHQHLELLVRTLLKLDPSALASLAAANGAGHTATAGLHELMRMVLARALSLLWASDDFTLHLHANASETALRGHSKIHNLVEFLAWALIRLPRRMRGSGELALCEADTKIVHLPQKADTSEPRSSVDELVRIATAILVPDFDAIRDAPGPSVSLISIRALMDEMLGVEPERLIRLYYDTQEQAEQAFARDPEGQALAGVSALLMRILHHYPMILDMQTENCVLGFQLAGADYNGPDGAAGANLGALLTAGLLADGARDVGFAA